MKVYPAILTGDIQKVQDQIDISSGLDACEVVHIDLIDGLFADNLTITPADLETCEFGSLQCDLHIMAIDPEDVVNEAVEFASMVPIRAVIGQVEKMGSEQSFVDAVRRQGWQAGLSLDVDTALDSIDEEIWKELQIVQVMGVVAGEQGQSFIERTLELVKEIAQLREEQHLQFELLVDGGIRPALISRLEKLGVNGCTMGSFLWKSDEPAVQWQKLSR
ncbi:hypothetical protein KA012_03320 [Candidatus Woesebacteria bacterium]|nr:hypothetical protein [Candidatus Woesebacteria bacterium]